MPVQIGPFANPSEVYAFYSLPYCPPAEFETKREDLGPLLKGDRPTKTLYEIKFRGTHLPSAAPAASSYSHPSTPHKVSSFRA